jgi:hypothetical protein
MGKILGVELIEHVVPADHLDEKKGSRCLAERVIKSIRWTKQTINIPLRRRQGVLLYQAESKSAQAVRS